MINCGITGSTGVLGKKIRKILPYKFYCFKKDITNYYDVKEWIDKKNLDLVIHLAAVVPTKVVNKNYIKARKINVIEPIREDQYYSFRENQNPNRFHNILPYCQIS